MEESRAKLKCQKCGNLGSTGDPSWMLTQCQHVFCPPCSRNLNTYSNNANYRQCSVCSSYSQYFQLPKFLFEKPEHHYKCVECETMDSEQNMQLCKTCHGLKFEDHEDVKKNALCSTCAIKKHIRQGHETVDFYPYLSAHNFSSHSSKIDVDSEEFEKSQDLLNKTFSNFSDLSINVSENYNVLTDMARRSKNTKNQLEFFEKMKNFISESKSINAETDSEVKKRATKLEENLKNIKEWYESKMENCVDESEVVNIEISKDSEEKNADVDA